MSASPLRILVEQAMHTFRQAPELSVTGFVALRDNLRTVLNAADPAQSAPVSNLLGVSVAVVVYSERRGQNESEMAKAGRQFVAEQLAYYEGLLPAAPSGHALARSIHRVMENRKRSNPPTANNNNNKLVAIPEEEEQEDGGSDLAALFSGMTVC